MYIAKVTTYKRGRNDHSRERNVLVAKRLGGETSWGRNVQGAKRQRGETSINPSNNMKSVGTLAVDGLAVTFGTASKEPTHALPRCTKCNSQPINGQCTNQWQSPYCCKWSTVLRFNVGIKELYTTSQGCLTTRVHVLSFTTCHGRLRAT